MKNYKKAIVASVLAVTLTLPVIAGKVSSEPAAKELIAKAIVHYKAVGQTQALKDFSVPGGDYVNGDLYLYCVSKTDNKINAHPVNKGLIGVNFYNLKDVDGRPFGKDMMEKAKGSKVGYVDYKWMNPATKKIGEKRTYFQDFGQDVCGVGVYK